MDGLSVSLNISKSSSVGRRTSAWMQQLFQNSRQQLTNLCPISRIYTCIENIIIGIGVISVWYQFGIDLVSVWYRFGIGLVSIGIGLVLVWYRISIDLVSFCNPSAILLIPICYPFGIGLELDWYMGLVFDWYRFAIGSVIVLNNLHIERVLTITYKNILQISVYMTFDMQCKLAYLNMS